MRWSDDTFTLFFNDLYPGLCRYLERLLGTSGGAQETAQEALLRLHRLGAGRIASGQERFWVYRVATRLALNELRRSRVRERVAKLLAPLFRSPDHAQPSPEEQVERSEREDHVRRALGRLPARQRALLLLREDEELSYAEIASLLGVSLAKIKTDLFRARRALRALLLAPTGARTERSAGTQSPR